MRSLESVLTLVTMETPNPFISVYFVSDFCILILIHSLFKKIIHFIGLYYSHEVFTLSGRISILKCDFYFVNPDQDHFYPDKFFILGCARSTS